MMDGLNDLPGHDVFNFGGLHATEDFELLILCLLPDGRGNEHFRETVEV